MEKGREMTRVYSAIIILAATLCASASATCAADAKSQTAIKITKAFKKATVEEESAGNHLVARNTDNITKADLDANGFVKSERWFGGARAPKDTLFLVKRDEHDYPYLCIMMTLEDDSSQYAGCVLVDDKRMFKATGSPFPQILTRLKGKPKLYKFNGNFYE